jgi:CheY-like chemotaxis protein
MTARRSRPIRVLLVEDNDMFAETIQLLLETTELADVVGRASDGAEGVALALSLEPDCVLMDVSMPVMDGIEATRAIRRRGLATRVVMLTSSADPADRAKARAVGADAYLTKECSLAELADVLGQPSVAAEQSRAIPPAVVHLPACAVSEW